jgi:hypothetical protein
MHTSRLVLTAILALSPVTLAHPGHDEPVDPDSPVYLALSVDPAAATNVTIETRDGYRYITSTGIPTHAMGRFPNRSNPNTVSPQKYSFRVPLAPKANDNPTEIHRGGLFGVALNGVVFDPGTAEFWKDDPALGWRMEAIGGPRKLGLDQNNAHVQPNGAYHYHGIPTGLVAQLSADKKQPLLLGYAADGYPIYGPQGYSDPNDPKSPLKTLRPSYKLKPGSRPADAPPGKYDGSYTRDWEYDPRSGELDENNGRTGVTPEYPDGTYYYVLTDTFPFVPRSFRATPDPSFDRKGPPPGGRRPRPGPRP